MFVKCPLAQASTFLDSCDFERENICGMIQGQGDKADWVRVAQAPGGPSTDYSNMGKCTGENYFAGNSKTQDAFTVSHSHYTTLLHLVLKQHLHSCMYVVVFVLTFKLSKSEPLQISLHYSCSRFCMKFCCCIFMDSVSFLSCSVQIVILENNLPGFIGLHSTY